MFNWFGLKNFDGYFLLKSYCVLWFFVECNEDILFVVVVAAVLLWLDIKKFDIISYCDLLLVEKIFILLFDLFWV